MAETKEDLLAALVRAREELRASYAGLTEAELTAPFLDGHWSVRDVLCHVAAWDWETVEAARAAAAGKPARYAGWDFDRWNQEQVAARAGRTVVEVEDEADRSFAALRACLESLPEAVLFTPGSPWGGRLIDPAEFFRVTVRHDRQHAAQIRRRWGRRRPDG